MMIYNEELYSIKKASQILGIHKITLHRWHKAGKIKCYYTSGRHRRFPKSELFRILENKSEIEIKIYRKTKVIVYARVSSQKQKDAGNLDRQLNRLIKYALNQDYEVVIELKEYIKLLTIV